MAESTNYGADADWDASGPVSPQIPWAEGPRAVALCLSRKLSIPTGSLEYCPDTVCLSMFLESNRSDSDIKQAVERVVRADERILDSLVRVTRSGGDVTIRIVARLATGTFDMVMSASVAAVNLVSLQENQA